MTLTIEVEFEPTSNRWIAEVMEVRGALVYGETKGDAIARVKALALEILAGEQRSGERDVADLSFHAPAA